ncbi:hypothetical protein [Streptomyces sp. NPDC056160]|uniref:hypothetical protein n=1 Tax=Streptomyces sp. NPDC056160 TaxID=3345731 RepID=UPI0035DC6923
MLALLAPGVQATLAAALADPARDDDHTVAGLASAVQGVNAQVGSLPMVRLQLLLPPSKPRGVFSPGPSQSRSSPDSAS